MKKVRCKFLESCNKMTCVGCETFEDRDYISNDKFVEEKDIDDFDNDFFSKMRIEFYPRKFVFAYRMIKERKLMDGFSEYVIPIEVYKSLKYQEQMLKN